jgi:glycosyltransferase involved in cell wall biosynthesis
MLSVLQVTPALDSGGVERTTIDMAEALTRIGGRAVVASRGGGLEGELFRAGGTLERIPTASKNPLTLVLNAYRIMRIARRWNVEIVHARSRAPAWSAFAAARLLRLPFVTTYHGVYNGRTGLKRFYNSVMARGDVVIANSEFTRDHVIATHGIDPDRIVTIPRGVDLDRFDPERVGPAERGAIRASWGADDTRLVVVLPARLTRWKGHDVMVEAAAKLEQAAPRRFLTVFVGGAFGREAYRDSLEQKIRAAGLANAVILAGHTDAMPAALSAADIAVCPSIEPEAFGRAAVEAQAMGLPVVASKLGGLAETIVDHETGLHVPPGDAAALAEALMALDAMGPDGRARLGAAGMARTQRLYSKAALQAATLQVYDRVTATQAVPAASRAEKL